MCVWVCGCVYAHGCTTVCDFAAGTNEAEGDSGEAGGVGEVAAQLEQQTLEEKERPEDAEEGIAFISHSHPHQQQWCCWSSKCSKSATARLGRPRLQRADAPGNAPAWSRGGGFHQ